MYIHTQITISFLAYVSVVSSIFSIPLDFSVGKMSAKHIITAVLGSFAIAFAADHFIADKKIFGGK